MLSLLYIVSSYFGRSSWVWGRLPSSSKNQEDTNGSLLHNGAIKRSASLSRRKSSAGQQNFKEAEQKGITLEEVLSEFHLSNSTLRQMMSDMNGQMSNGLIGGLDTSTIAMLPSFVPTLPDGTEHGKYLAMDLGGTNLRVMLMIIEPGKEPYTEQRNFRILNSVMSDTGDALFDFIVSCLVEFLEEKGLMDAGLSLGFTFSYPCDQQSLRCAKLLRWTKGFDASGVEGNDVVEILERAIDKHGKLRVKVTALINDTVGTQVATAETHKVCDIGVIVATGTNCSYMEKVSHMKKLCDTPFPYDQMIIDTEWGGFGDGEADYIKTQYDKVVDQHSVHPGVQSFDKLVAGMYMGELVRLVLEKLVEEELIFKGIGSDAVFEQMTFPTKYISEILSDEGGHYDQTRMILDELGVEDYLFSDILLLREVCMVVSRRSANLAAAAIACVIKRIGKKKVVVGIDGSTYKYHPFYHYWVKEKVRDLLPEDFEFQLVQAGDGSGKGAALVAAIAERLAADSSRLTTGS